MDDMIISKPNCANCRWHATNPRNMQEVECRLNPPDNMYSPGPMGQGMQVMVIPRRVMPDYCCSFHKPVEH